MKRYEVHQSGKFELDPTIDQCITDMMKGELKKVGYINAENPKGAFVASNHPDRETFEPQIERLKDVNMYSLSVGDVLLELGDEYLTKVHMVDHCGWVSLTDKEWANACMNNATFISRLTKVMAEK